MAYTLEDIMNAIHKVETRGYSDAGKYTAIGKPNSKGQKAYGKYQVMDYNVPVWTKEALGKALTPQQFLNNPQAQEAVAKYRMGELYKKYGNASDVASVWFTGQPVAKAGNVKDVTGTTNNQYVAAVNKELGILSKNPNKGIGFNPQAAAAGLTQGGQTAASVLLNAYRNLFGVNPALKYERDTPTQPAPAPVPLARRWTPNGKITVPFGGSTAQEKFHPGVDIAAPKGTPIPANVTGIVTHTDYGHQKGENNYGNTAIVTDANGNKHRYSHMNKGYVQVGQPVKKGMSSIGEFGDTGATYSPSGGDSTNLDYRITDAYGKYKNPMLYLKNQL